jgi:gas vesicle protein
MEHDNGNRFIWFVAGAAVGAAVALLYAPQTGTETRKLIKDKSKEGADAVAETSRDMYERGRELYEKGRRLADEAVDLLERGKEIVEKATSTVQEQIREATQQV